MQTIKCGISCADGGWVVAGSRRKPLVPVVKHSVSEGINALLKQL